MKSKRLIVSMVLVGLLSLSIDVHSKDTLMVFCGAAFKQPMEEVVKAFNAGTRSEVVVTYGGVGTLLAQILLARQGDLFVAPSSYIIEQARSKGALAPGPVKPFAYVAPAINVQKGNPRGITCLRDLTGPSLRVAVANPEIVFTGMLAVEILEKSLSPDQIAQFKKNLVTYPEDVSKLATTLVLGNVDAIIGLHNFSAWYPDKVDTVKLKATEVQRIGAGQVAVLAYSKNVPLAEAFREYLVSSKESRQVFAKYHYFPTAQQAFVWIGAVKPVGGEGPASAGWFKN